MVYRRKNVEMSLESLAPKLNKECFQHVSPSTIIGALRRIDDPNQNGSEMCPRKQKLFSTEPDTGT